MRSEKEEVQKGQKMAPATVVVQADPYRVLASRLLRNQDIFAYHHKCKTLESVEQLLRSSLRPLVPLEHYNYINPVVQLPENQRTRFE